jgi:hypothetical protein
MRKMLGLVGALALVAACSESPTGRNPAPVKRFSAKVDGAEWQSDSTKLTGTAGESGMFTVTGFDSTRAVPLGVTLSLYNIDKPGTYPLGMGPTTIGGSVRITEGTSNWFSHATGGQSGSVVLTTVSSTRLAGVFAVTAGPYYGSFPAARTGNFPAARIGSLPAERIVTGASFDVPVVSSGSIEVPRYNGSTITGTMGGASWGAANVKAQVRPNGVLLIEASNVTHDVVLSIEDFAGPGTYAFGAGGPGYLRIKTQPTGWFAYPGSMSGGTVVVTSANSARVAGAINITAFPGLGSENAGLLKFVASFDVGLKYPPDPLPPSFK